MFVFIRSRVICSLSLFHSLSLFLFHRCVKNENRPSVWSWAPSLLMCFIHFRFIKYTDQVFGFWRRCSSFLCYYIGNISSWAIKSSLSCRNLFMMLTPYPVWNCCFSFFPSFWYWKAYKISIRFGCWSISVFLLLFSDFLFWFFFCVHRLNSYIFLLLRISFVCLSVCRQAAENVFKTHHPRTPRMHSQNEIDDCAISSWVQCNVCTLLAVRHKCYVNFSRITKFLCSGYGWSLKKTVSLNHRHTKMFV